MGFEELQLEAIKLEARELELMTALEETHDARMLSLGRIQGYQMCQRDVEQKIKAELEAQKQKE